MVTAVEIYGRGLDRCSKPRPISRNVDRRVGVRSRFADRMNERRVLYPPHSLLRLAVVKAFRDSGLAPVRAAVTTLSLSMRTSLLATGDFMSLVPASVF